MKQLDKLSNREWDVMKLLLQGKSNKLIASSLGISIRTVEFHLKNIYAKFEVSSRTELILKLANATGNMEIEKLRYSTVEGTGKRAENRDTLNSGKIRAASFADRISIISKELEMKNLLNSKHVLVGVAAALLTGFAWIITFSHFGHMTFNSIAPWIIPLAIILGMIGIVVGAAGKRNGNTLIKVFFSTVIGTGFSAFAMIPIVGFVVYPLAKLAEGLGLIDRAAISTEITSTLVIVAMIATWLIVGAAIGVALLLITTRRPGQAGVQRHVSENSL